MQKRIAVLNIEDSESDSDLIARLLEKAGYQVTFERVETAAQMRAALKKRAWDIIISDHSLPEFDSYGALALLHEEGLDIPLIVISGTIGEEAVADMMKAGAHDFLVKDNLTRVLSVVEREIENANVRHERRHAEEELRENEIKFSAAFHSSPLAFVITTLDGKLIEVNRAFCELTGYSYQEVIGKTTVELELLSIQDREKLVTALTNADGVVNNFEVQFRVRDGSLRDILYSLETILIHGESRRLSTGLDITERKKAQEKIIASEVRYRRLFEAAKDGILILDADTGEIVDVNPFLMELLGYSHTEFLGKQIWEISLFKDIVANKAAFLKLQQEKYIRYENLPLETKDGRFIWVEFVSNVYDAGTGQVIQCNIRDITKRKQAEQALSESEERLRQVWESTSDAMAITDSDGIVLSVNPAATRLYGYTPEKIIGQSFSVTLSEQAHQQTIEQYKALFLSDFIPPTFESTVRRADGAERITESSLTFLTDASGQRIAMLTTFRDITERKQTDGALIASEKRYRGLFEDSPISIWEEDFSLVKRRIDMLRERGVSDFQSYFASHIDEVMECASLVKITDVNKAALQMYQAEDAEQMLGSLRQVITANTVSSFQGELLTIAEGRTTFHWEGTDRTLMGKPIEVNLNWSVSPGHEDDYSKVIVSTIDITERKLAEKQTQRQLERLQALRTIDIAISSSFDIKLTLEVLLSQTVNMLNTDAAAILLFHPFTKTLEYAANRGFRSTTIRGAKVGLGDGYAGRAILERGTVHIPNLIETSSQTRQAQLLHGEDFVDYFCTPLIVKGEVKGALEIFHRNPLVENPEWLDFLETLAGQAAIAIENSQLFDGLQRSNIELSMAYDATIEGWSHALDLRDKETEGHSLRVTDLTLKLAEEMGIGEVELVNIRRGALLHDIGKMGVPDNILLKPGKLTDLEWDKMRQHPGFAYEMLSGIDYLKPALDIPYCHHEKWDGSGYPRGLKGEEIPLAARIFAVVDVWDALCSDRSYRAGWPNEKALEFIKSESGRHFDPHVVDAFLNLIIET